MAGYASQWADSSPLQRSPLARVAAAAWLLFWTGYCAAQATSLPETDRPKVSKEHIAEILQRIKDQNARPRVTFITPSTESARHAILYKRVTNQILEFGTRNFPQKNGKKMYGDMVVEIPVYQDGSLYMKKGGPRVTTKSGNPALDRAALDIVRRAAPFAPFYTGTATPEHDDVWMLLAPLSFTREQAQKADAPELQ